MNDCDSFLTTISEQEKNTDLFNPKFISATKWQHSMVDILKQMTQKYKQKKNLLTDLVTIVSSVPEASFVQATLKIRPFKPEFSEERQIFDMVTESTVSETVAKNIRFTPCKIKSHEQLKKKQRITQKTLTKQFERDYHPFKFIIKNFKRLLELKFKSVLDSKKITSLQTLSAQVKSDMVILSQFLHKASQPYKKLFKCPSNNNQQEENAKFQQFMDTYLQDNQKLNKCVLKILSYGCTKFFKQQIDSQLPDQAIPSDFNLPQQFTIDGGYIRTISSLMQFAQIQKPDQLMKKLIKIRQNILVDISSYYQDRKQHKQLQVNSELQIQILRFCVAKLKGWSVEILAHIKFLEFVFGEEEMGYKYEESSYIYTQLSMVYEIIGINTQQSNKQIQ